MSHTTLILYFTGTGNSRLVSQTLAAQIDGAVLHPLMQEDGLPEALAEAACVGLAFPVHFYQCPRVVLDRLAGLDLTGKRAFVLASCGGDPGMAPDQAAAVLAARGAQVIARLSLALADNSVVLKTDPALAAANLAAVPAALGDFARRLADPSDWDAAVGAGAAAGPWRRLTWTLASHALRIGMQLVYRHADKRVDLGACSGCGICAAACPVGNIDLHGGRAAIGTGCADCFGCLHACPVSAISFGRIRVSPDTRYRLATG